MESLTTADNQLKTGSAVGAVYAADATTVGGLQRRDNHELVSNAFYAVRLETNSNSKWRWQKALITGFKG